MPKNRVLLENRAFLTGLYDGGSGTPLVRIPCLKKPVPAQDPNPGDRLSPVICVVRMFFCPFFRLWVERYGPANAMYIAHHLRNALPSLNRDFWTQDYS